MTTPSTDIDPRDAETVLRNLRKGRENLKRAVRWEGGSNRWTENEKQAAVRDEQRAKAKALVASAPAERIAALAVRCSVTPATMVKRLRSDAHWQPGLVIGLLA